MKFPIISICSLFFVISPAQIIITEVMYNLQGSDSPNEFVEIYNLGMTSIDLSGWTISDTQSDDDLVGESFLLGPSQYGLIMEGDYDGLLYAQLIPASALILFVDGNAIGNNLNNTTDSLYLVDAEGDTMDSMGWGRKHRG